MEASTDQQRLTLERLTGVVRRRWRIVVAGVVVTGGLAVLFSALQREQYTSSASLLFRNPGYDQIVFGSTFFQQQVDPTRQAATNIDLVSLPTVAARTAGAVGGGLTTARVRAEVSVSAAGQSDVATVSATDPSPTQAAQIANAYAEQYILFRQQADRAKIAGAQTQIKRLRASLTPQQQTSSIGQSLVNRANQLQILASLQTGNAELVQRATKPHSPSSPNTVRNGILGALLGLMLGLGLAALADRLDRRLRDSEAVEEAYGVPILGVVPERAALSLAHATEPLPGGEAETFGLLRARLRYFNVDRELRSLLVTSAAPAEGKTTIALHLAIAEAVAGGSRVVLLEANLRRPTLARRLGIEPGNGLAEVVSHSSTLESSLQPVSVLGRSNEGAPEPQFDILAAGAVPPNPAELMESESMKNLLTTLTEQYDLLIIDSPPVSVVSDAIPLMQQVSGVLIVARIGRTSRDAARHLRGQLIKLGAPTLGVVANGAPPRDRGYHGYAYGYAHYGERGKLDPRKSQGQPADAESVIGS